MSAPAVAQQPTEVAQPDAWSLPKRVAFRFLFVYLVLYLTPFPIGAIPGTDKWPDIWNKPFFAIVPWFGKHVLRLHDPATHHETGSGDTLYDFVLALFLVVLSVLATVIWSVLSKRREHGRLYGFLCIYVRYWLAFSMLSYGLIKAFPSQFPPNDPARLLEPYGRFSPMGVVWSMMGASAAYTIISGLAETVGGLLLLWRRTAGVGALMLLAVIGNVVLLNFCFDVPVKLYSSLLWLTALFLAWPHLRELYGWLKRGAEPRRRWMRVVKTLLIGCMLFSAAAEGWKGYSEWSYGRKPRAFEGLWEVEELSGGAPKWKAVGLGKWRAAVRTADDPWIMYGIEYDEKKNLLSMMSRDEKLEFVPTLADAENLLLDGRFVVRLRRANPDKTLLTSRRFHWIQEYPFNR